MYSRCNENSLQAYNKDILFFVVLSFVLAEVPSAEPSMAGWWQEEGSSALLLLLLDEGVLYYPFL
jgi:hypothetical protein